MSKKITLTLSFDEDLEKRLKAEVKELYDYRILSESLDARGANRGRKPRVNYSIEVIRVGEKFEAHLEEFKKLSPMKNPPLIVGAGPAGLFAALRLLEYGIPSILFERGEPAGKRMRTIADFWRRGQLNPESNVCFGEGGAGLFSDGKLITRVKSPHVKYVMKKLVEFGAPKEVAYLSNPHVGSNKLREVIKKISRYLTEKGCEIHYNTKVTELHFNSGGCITGLTAGEREYESHHVVLATGHSAKDIYHHLHTHNVSLEAKDFAVGVRVEHPRTVINQLQYGKFCNNPLLETARYRLTHHNDKTDRGTYSFCMCPGGHVLSSGTETDGLVSNGMSNFRRHSPWSNSAIIVSVKKGIDFSLDGNPLDGLRFQKDIEHHAYKYSLELASGKELPSIKLLDFLEGKKPLVESVKTSCPSGLFPHNFEKILPGFILEHLKNSFVEFDRKMKGYVSKEALLIGPETRTSSAVTITRNRGSFDSVSHKGLYPTGEGAGYAGGITSAATDGVHVAMAILKSEFDF